VAELLDAVGGFSGEDLEFAHNIRR
jgi:hypothetical protein